MSKLQWDEQEKMDLLASLEALLGCMRSLHSTVGAVMNDVAAIRNTVFEDPEDMAAYRADLRRAVKTSRPKAEAALSSYDDLIQKIAESQRYPN
jgi:hypothetical protein